MNSKKQNYVIPVPLSPGSLIKCLSHEPPKRDKNEKKLKITDSNFIIPKPEECSILLQYNYRVSQLKTICRFYSQKVSGNKPELLNRIYNYLRLSKDAIKIQRCVKLYLLHKYNMLKGPARYNRVLCVNDTDFFSMDDIAKIPYQLFVSFMDTDNIIYGFNINSLHVLFKKDKGAKNPYNRKDFPKYVVTIVAKLLKLSKVVNDKIVLEKVEEDLTPKQRIEMRTLNVFQSMDMLNHYTDILWFSSLERRELIRFIRHMTDIWLFRAELSLQAKQEISPPHGDPFRTVPVSLQYNILNYTTDTLKRISLTIMENMVLYGINDASKYLGSTYVLCALTLVNANAAVSLPSLYAAVYEDSSSLDN